MADRVFPTSIFEDETECADGNDFLNRLDLSHRYWSDGAHDASHNPWLFRGLPDRNYALIPSAWREAGIASLAKLRSLPEIRVLVDELLALDKQWGHAGLPRREETYLHVMGELQAIVEFSNLADRIGFLVQMETKLDAPKEYKNRRSLEIRGSGKTALIKPTRAMALAQHHGVPTRLLDFTYSPRVAAYFAGWQFESAIKKPTRIAVVAIHESIVTNKNVGIQKYVVPRYQFEFLHQQHGLFLFVNYPESHFGPNGVWPDFEHVFLHYNEHFPNEPFSFKLRVLSLAGEKVPEMMALLRKCDISRAQLMPSFDNVKESLYDFGLLCR